MTSTPQNAPPPGGEWRGGSWSWSAEDHEPAAPDPLARRLWKLIVGLSVLLIGLGGYAWLRDGGLNPIAQAAEKTRQLPGSRATVFGTVSVPGQAASISMRGRQVSNARTGRSRAILTMRLPNPIGNVKLEAVGDELTIFLRSRLFSRELPPGREWLGMQPWLGASAETMLPSGSDTKGQLEMLEVATGGVKKLGEEEVRGVATSRYRGKVDLAHYAETLREDGNDSAAQHFERLAQAGPSANDVEAWIDDRGLLRRFRMVMSQPSSSSEDAAPVTVDMVMDFTDFGITPAIRLPRPGNVFDATPLVRVEMDLLTGESFGRPSRSMGSPLSAGPFRQRASRICRQMSRRFDERGGPAAFPTSADAFRALASDYLVPALRIAERGITRLRGLRPPPHLQANYQRLLRLAAIEGEILLAEARAMEIGQLKLVQSLHRRFERLSRRSDRLAKRLGLPACVSDNG